MESSLKLDLDGLMAAQKALRESNMAEACVRAYLQAAPQDQGLSEATKALCDALCDLDDAVEPALLAGVSGDADQIDAALHTLDEVRGRIWATYSPASDMLKERSRSQQGEAE